VFIKATEGATREDDQFCQNWEKAKENNLLRGAYHFYRPARTPEEQAAIFFSKVELEKGDLPPVVDFETTNKRSKSQIQYGLSRFLRLLENKYQVKPIIYTNLSYYKNYIRGKFDNYPIWIACYWGEDTLKTLNYNWHFWQHSSVGKVNGIQGSVDFNVFKGTLDELKAMCIP
jgi:lysozyme